MKAETASDDLRKFWRGKSDSELIAAASSLENYREDARQAIQLEIKRRGLDRPCLPMAEPAEQGPGLDEPQVGRFDVSVFRVLAYSGVLTASLAIIRESINPRPSDGPLSLIGEYVGVYIAVAGMPGIVAVAVLAGGAIHKAATKGSYGLGDLFRKAYYISWVVIALLICATTVLELFWPLS
jgi:hypothetical protein